MSNSNVFDTLLRHFGGTEQDETDIDPTMISADPISFQVVSQPSSRHTSNATPMDDLKNSVRRVSSSSKDADAALRISSEVFSIDGSNNSGCSGHSHNSYSYQSQDPSSTQRRTAWMTSGICTMSNSLSNNVPVSPQSSFPSSMNMSSCNPGWASVVDPSQVHSSSPVSALPFGGSAGQPMNNFASSAPSNNKSVVGAWSNESALLLDDLASSMQAPNKKARKKQDAGKPKRPLSAYNIFFKEERQRILDTLPQEVLKQADKEDVGKSRRRKQLSAKDLLHRKVDFHKLAKMVGRRWRELPASELEQYKAIADADLKRYKDEMNAYKASMLIQEMGDQQQQQQQPQASHSDDNAFFQGFEMHNDFSFHQPTALQ